MQTFAAEMGDVTRLGVAFERPGNAVGHAVVYELVSPHVGIKASDAHKKVAAAAKDGHRRAAWKYVDYQADSGGKDVTADVATWFPKIIFAVEGGSKFARTAIFTKEDQRVGRTADNAARAQKESKAKRADIIRARRGLDSGDEDDMDVDE